MPGSIRGSTTRKRRHVAFRTGRNSMTETVSAADPSAARDRDGSNVPNTRVLAATQTPRRSSSVWRRFRRHRLAMAGLAILALLVFLAVFAPLLTPHPPQAIDLRAYQVGPSLDHPLGTDKAGRDIFSRLLYAGRVSLRVGLVAVSIYTAIGVVL